jgi:hypothetical protein
VSSVQYDAATNTAKYFLSGPIPDGNFRATVSGVNDPANNPVTGTTTQDFYFLTGDANADRKVNALDFNALASHFGITNAGLSGGDFDLNGAVNTADFTAMAARWAKAVPAPALSAPATVFAAPTGSTAPASSLFSDRSILAGDRADDKLI